MAVLMTLRSRLILSAKLVPALYVDAYHPSHGRTASPLAGSTRERWAPKRLRMGQHDD